MHENRSRQAPDPLAQLNDRQREAVLAVEGPTLVLAGAGSGKTRVITHRIAHLVGSGLARPDEVFAVTFTNKAAGEMKQRVEALLDGAHAQPAPSRRAAAVGDDEEPRRPSASGLAGGVWVGTFHALCLRILRRDAPMLGYQPGFAIYDTSDQLAALRAFMKEQHLDDTAESARAMLHRISAAKNRLRTVEIVEKDAIGPGGELFVRCYRGYQDSLRKNNAMDFDDLLMQVLALFEQFPGVAARYAQRCRFLLVDEYQDTNRAQYLMVKALAAAHRNVCSVGDPDQSIYAFRGADIQNILDFQSDYPDAQVIRLEQNYRSTRTILAAADAVIARNTERMEKTLWTENAEGDPVQAMIASNDRAEAEHVLELVRGLTRAGRAHGDIAILYRTNNQSRLFEEVFLRERIPHRVVGSLRFYERKEIKDIVAWLRVLLNPADDLAVTRISNIPPRGIGKGTLDDLGTLAAGGQTSLFHAMELAVERGSLPGRAHKAIEEFLALVESLRADADSSLREESAGRTPIVRLIGQVLLRIGYAAWLEKSNPGDHEARLENLDALTSAAAEYDEEGAPEGLQGFVDRSSLRSDTDEVKGGWGDGGVTLMTVHSAKGLEFPVVIVAGLEENVFPHIRSSDSPSELEEERRLFYVAVTRAKEKLYLTAAGSRRSFGDFVENATSRFFDEIPSNLIEMEHERPLWRAEPAADDQTTTEVRRWGAWRGGGGAATGSARKRIREFNPWAASPERDSIHYDEGEGGPVSGYSVGMKVTHPMFGRGTIAAVEGAGDGVKLTIRFGSAGVRKILPRHTSLTIG